MTADRRRLVVRPYIPPLDASHRSPRCVKFPVGTGFRRLDTEEILGAIAEGAVRAVISTVAVAELLVKPFEAALPIRGSGSCCSGCGWFDLYVR